VKEAISDPKAPQNEREERTPKKVLAANKRPLAFLAISVACLLLHHVLLRAMAHGHVAHVLLGAGNAPPPASAAAVAITLLVIRLLTVIVVPGLLLAAAAEIVAYLLVGPTREASDDPLA